MATIKSTQPTTRQLALYLAILDPITQALNTSVVLFPHVAILALMGASGAWWGALAFLVVLLTAARRERSKVTEKLLSCLAIPVPTESAKDPQP